MVDIIELLECLCHVSAGVLLSAMALSAMTSHLSDTHLVEQISHLQSLMTHALVHCNPPGVIHTSYDPRKPDTSHHSQKHTGVEDVTPKGAHIVQPGLVGELVVPDEVGAVGVCGQVLEDVAPEVVVLAGAPAEGNELHHSSPGTHPEGVGDAYTSTQVCVLAWCGEQANEWICVSMVCCQRASLVRLCDVLQASIACVRMCSYTHAI